MLAMTRPALLVYRWFGFGDVRAVLDPQRGLLFNAVDVCKYLEIEVESQYDRFAQSHRWFWPVDVVHIDVPRPAWAEPDPADPTDYLTVVACHQLADQFLNDYTPAFLQWLTETIEVQEQVGAETIIAKATPTPPAALGRSFSIARAARILSGDPAIELGQDSLFLAMKAKGWVQRIDGIWRPSEDLVKIGFLVRQPKRIPGQRQLYPQIRITEAGMQSLHRELQGVATLNLSETPHLTLLEI